MPRIRMLRSTWLDEKPFDENAEYDVSDRERHELVETFGYAVDVVAKPAAPAAAQPVESASAAPVVETADASPAREKKIRAK